MPFRGSEKFQVFNLRETYHEFGSYDFKVFLSPKLFKNSHLSSMDLIDSDGRAMRFTLDKWGRKMNCSFILDRTVSDGVSTARLSLVDDLGNIHESFLRWWVIKP